MNKAERENIRLQLIISENLDIRLLMNRGRHIGSFHEIVDFKPWDTPGHTEKDEYAQVGERVQVPCTFVLLWLSRGVEPLECCMG